jgi:UDP-3-O-[3-hydroxymyristoyl] glucosamine N-acyltransferase
MGAEARVGSAVGARVFCGAVVDIAVATVVGWLVFVGRGVLVGLGVFVTGSGEAVDSSVSVGSGVKVNSATSVGSAVSIGSAVAVKATVGSTVSVGRGVLVGSTPTVRRVESTNNHPQHVEQHKRITAIGKIITFCRPVKLLIRFLILLTMKGSSN